MAIRILGKDSEDSSNRHEVTSSSLSCDDEQPGLLECSQSSFSSSSSDIKKTVAFKGFVTVREFSMNKPLTSAEKENLYYNKVDFSYFGKSTRLLARQVRFATKGGFTPPQEELRGLEDQLTLRAMIDHKTRKTNVIKAVKNEQERQRSIGDYDANSFRKVSLKVSRESLKVALDQGREDSKCARAICKGSGQKLAWPSEDKKKSQMLHRTKRSPIRPNNKFASIQHPARALGAVVHRRCEC